MFFSNAAVTTICLMKLELLGSRTVTVKKIVHRHLQILTMIFFTYMYDLLYVHVRFSLHHRP